MDSTSETRCLFQGTHWTRHSIQEFIKLKNIIFAHKFRCFL